MIESFITIIAFLFISRCVLAGGYDLIQGKYKKLNDNKYFFTRFFKHPEKVWLYFWASFIWLFLYAVKYKLI